MECRCKESSLWPQHNWSISEVFHNNKVFSILCIAFQLADTYVVLQCLGHKVQSCGTYFCVCSSIWRVFIKFLSWNFCWNIKFNLVIWSFVLTLCYSSYDVYNYMFGFLHIRMKVWLYTIGQGIEPLIMLSMPIFYVVHFLLILHCCIL